MTNRPKSIFRRIKGSLVVGIIDNEAGGSLVELALGISLCAVILLGAGEFGRLAYASIEVNNAANAGAQYGAQNHATASDTSGMQTMATTDGGDLELVERNCFAFLPVLRRHQFYVRADRLRNLHIVEYVKVVTTSKFDPKIYVPGLPKSYSVSGQAIVEVIQ